MTDVVTFAVVETVDFLLAPPAPCFHVEPCPWSHTQSASGACADLGAVPGVRATAHRAAAHAAAHAATHGAQYELILHLPVRTTLSILALLACGNRHGQKQNTATNMHGVQISTKPIKMRIAVAAAAPHSSGGEPGGTCSIQSGRGRSGRAEAEERTGWQCTAGPHRMRRAQAEEHLRQACKDSCWFGPSALLPWSRCATQGRTQSSRCSCQLSDH